MSKIFLKSFFIFILFIIFCFVALVFALNSVDSFSLYNNETSINYEFSIYDADFIWPVPGYNSITSHFGYRKAPTSGAGTFHGGIDIGAPTGAQLLASFSGVVTYIGFYGPNGYTVQISNGTYLATYSHLSPYFLVYVGQPIEKGDVIAIVGPKNVYGVPNNPYKDSKGVPTNRCNNWTTSAFFHKKRRPSRQSFRFFLNSITYRRLHLRDDNHVRNSHNRLLHIHHLLPSLVLSCYGILGK